MGFAFPFRPFRHAFPFRPFPFRHAFPFHPFPFHFAFPFRPCSSQAFVHWGRHAMVLDLVSDLVLVLVWRRCHHVRWGGRGQPGGTAWWKLDSAEARRNIGVGFFKASIITIVFNHSQLLSPSTLILIWFIAAHLYKNIGDIDDTNIDVILCNLISAMAPYYWVAVIPFNNWSPPSKNIANENRKSLKMALILASWRLANKFRHIVWYFMVLHGVWYCITSIVWHGPQLHWYYRNDPKWVTWHWCWSESENPNTSWPSLTSL